MHPGSVVPFLPSRSSLRLLAGLVLAGCQFGAVVGCAVTPGRATIQSVQTVPVARNHAPVNRQTLLPPQVTTHLPTGSQQQVATAARVHHQLKVPHQPTAPVGTPLPLAGDKVAQRPANGSLHPPQATASAGKPQRPRSSELKLVSGEEPAPAREASKPPADRPRANRLIERARHNLELGFEEEALRLAQIAERLEFSERVQYAPGEETPSQFIDRVWGDRRPPLPDFPAAIAVAQSRRMARRPVLATAEPAPATLPTTPTPVATEVVPREAVATAGPVPEEGETIEIPALTDEEFEALAATAKRFNRSPHRRKTPAPPTTPATPTVIVALPTETSETVLESDETAHSDTEVASTAEAELDVPLEVEEEDLLALEEDWPVLLASDPPAAPVLPMYWNWHRVCLTGFLSGLASLLVLWIWREIERWHYRVTRPV